MAILMGDLRTALVAAGAPEDLANKAAMEVATYDARLAGINIRLSLLTWMMGASIALSTTTLFCVFRQIDQ